MVGRGTPGLLFKFPLLNSWRYPFDNICSKHTSIWKSGSVAAHYISF